MFNKNAIKKVTYTALTFVGTIVGSGFASGQEVLQFFGIYGVPGILGIVLSFFMFIIYGYMILSIGYHMGWDNYEQLFSNLFKKRTSIFFDFIFSLFLLGISSVMVAGAGAVINNYLHVPNFIGSLFTLLLALLIVNSGITGIIRVNTLIVPLLIIFILVVAWLTIDLKQLSPRPIAVAGMNQGSWLVSAVFYVSYNIGLALGVILPMGKTMPGKIPLLMGAVGGGTILCILLGAIYCSLQSMPIQYLSTEIPLLIPIDNYPFFKTLFSFILWAEIFTTLISTCFSFFCRIENLVSSKFNILFWILLFFLGQIGFSKLIRVLYPIFGFICFFLLIGITWQIFRLPHKRII